MRRSPRTCVSILAVLGFAVPLTGCGGGSSTASPEHPATTSASTAQTTTQAKTPTTPLGRPRNSAEAQLIVKADAICRRANVELAASKPKSAERAEILRVVPGNEAVEMRAAAELRDLKAPASLTRTWATIVDERRTLAKQLGTLVAKTESYDTVGVKRLTESKISLHKKLAAIARAAGFKDCSEYALQKNSGKGVPRT